MHVDYTGYLVIQGYLMAEVLSINKASASDLLAVGYNCFQGTTHNAMIYFINDTFTWLHRCLTHDKEMNADELQLFKEE